MIFISFIHQWILSLYCCGGILFLSCIIFSGNINTSQGYVLKPPRALLDAFEASQNKLHSSTNNPNGSEIVQVKFIIPLRHKRDLTERDFHIIHIHRPTANSTTIIHLSRKTSLVSSNFKIVVKNGDEESLTLSEEQTKSDCLYHGAIVSEPRGSVAFSACGEHLGFSGLIMNTDEHWMIEPHPVPINTFHETLQFPHLIHLPESFAPQIKQQYKSDAITVPLEELEKADELERLANEAKNELKNEDDQESMNQNSMLDLDDENDPNQNTDNIMTLKGKTSSNKKGKTKSAPKQVIEIAVFTDTEFFNKMKKTFPKDTINNIKNYVLTVINAMDLLYEQPSLGLSIAFRLVHLEIQQKAPSGLNNHNGQGTKYITSFCDYAGGMNEGNELWDHSLMLTGLDIHEGGSTGTLGLAFAGTMCYRYYSCSVSEATHLGVIYIITHEIGHSVGMAHDGTGVSAKCHKEKNIMSPTTGGGKVTWSTCSSQNINDFITYGSSEKKKRPKPDCLSESSEIKSIDYTSSTLPGQKFDLNQQCAVYDKSYTPYLKAPYNNPCPELYCRSATRVMPVHPALEGSTCETGKMCRGGKCVTK